MPRTPDSFPGALEEFELRLLDSQFPDALDQYGTIIYADGYLWGVDEYGCFNLRLSASGGITEDQHEVLDTLVHDIDETSYDEVVYSGNKVQTYTVWESAAKLKKIREETYSYSGNKVSQVVTVQYDGAGAVKMTMTEVYTYSGSKVTSITRTKS